MTRKAFNYCYDNLLNNPNQQITGLFLFPNKHNTFRETLEVPFGCDFTPDSLEVKLLDCDGSREFLHRYMTESLQQDDFKVVSVKREDIREIITVNTIDNHYVTYR